MFVKSCVRSGVCCKTSACGFGEWDDKLSQCKFLEFDANGLANCGNYDEIIKDPSSVFSPAFGAGCCMSMFNRRRDEIIKQFHNNEIPIIEIDDWD